MFKTMQIRLKCTKNACIREDILKRIYLANGSEQGL